MTPAATRPAVPRQRGGALERRADAPSRDTSADVVGGLALTLFLAFGGVLGVFVGVDPPPATDPGYSLVSGIICLLAAPVMWHRRRSVRKATLHVCAVLGIAATTCGVYLGRSGFTGNAAPYFYAWCALIVFAVFPPRTASVYVGASSVGLAAVLFATSPPDALATWVLVTGTMVGAGVVVGVLLSRLEDLASRDPLTMLLNRQALEPHLERAIRAARTHRHDTTVALFDLNDFKRVNDQAGHQRGDDVLVAVARLLTAQLRAHDVVVRYGGDEFVLILPRTDRAGASAVISRLDLPIRSSAGLADVRPDDVPGGILHRADIDLYRAKALSRRNDNAVTLSVPAVS